MFKLLLLQTDNIYTYVVYGINKWIVTAIAHGKPIETEPYDVDVRISEVKQTIFYFSIVVRYSIIVLESKRKILIPQLFSKCNSVY